ncbi:hypothetical protein [Bacillus bombysepticus]|uniref:hypothetical protein n=1 Tax=Bacillus bombysepticus TaxID=658666 RepID=UPI0030198E9D
MELSIISVYGITRPVMVGKCNEAISFAFKDESGDEDNQDRRVTVSLVEFHRTILAIKKLNSYGSIQKHTDSFYSGSNKGNLNLRYKEFDETYLLEFDNGTRLEFHSNELLTVLDAMNF